MKGAGLVKFAVDSIGRTLLFVTIAERPSDVTRLMLFQKTQQKQKSLFVSACNKGTTDEARYCMRLQFGNDYHAQFLLTFLQNKRLITEVDRAVEGECLAKCNEEKIHFGLCTYSIRTFTELNFLLCFR
jgi:hypothetical protein